jgi:hypothetical protein
MIPSPENWSSVPSNWLTSGPNAPWYSRRKSSTSSGSADVEHLLRLGRFGKGGVAAQIAEHDDNLAAVAFKDLFVAPRDDQFGELRGEKAL